MQVPDSIKLAISQAQAGLYGEPHAMAFPEACAIIREWADDNLPDMWRNDDTGEETDSQTCAEGWVNEDAIVHFITRQHRIKELVGARLASYI
ncbi:hypothetical protein PQQ87_08400 [Paraburkholderia nemoris]|uniref:hypothetical protein n=1 Tax=Paraburkholderia nemoris TaxID=2793076 RepID=UPI0038B6B708